MGTFDPTMAKVPIMVARVTTIFQLFCHYSNKNQDIFLKFSAFLHHMCVLNHGRHYYLDPQVDPKIAKRHFFQDIQNSFQWPTGIGLEPHQKNFQKKIPTNTVARAVQNFGQNGPLLAG